MSANSGAWGIAMWQENKTNIFPGNVIIPSQEQGISISGGEEIDGILPTVPLGCLLIPPDGLGVPGVRSGDVTFAERDGVQQFGDYYEPRQITLRVSICNEGCPGCPSARQRVKRLTTEWSRSCARAALVLFTDCHAPGATLEERTYLGPYLVYGRPRVADVTWMRSNRGCADITLRFDAEDARLLLVDTSSDTWSAAHTVAETAGDNIAVDYRLTSRTMGDQDATVEDSTITGGAPDGGSYFSRFVTVPNTLSPFAMSLADSGLNGIPVTAGNDYTVAWWARRIPAVGMTTQSDILWYDAGGTFISLSAGTPHSPGEDWERLTQTHTAPVGAAFMEPYLLWSGIAAAGQVLDFAQGWMNEGSTAGEPEKIQVVGDLCVFPSFRMDGPLTGPITISYGPYSFSYDEDIGALDPSVTVDTRWGRASSTGVDLTQNLLGDYTLPLPLGENDFSFTTGDPADTGDVVAQWENAVISG